MTVIGIFVILFLILWGFLPLRAFFPNLLLPALLILVLIGFLGFSSLATGF